MKLDNTRIKNILLEHGLNASRVKQALEAKRYHATLPRHNLKELRKNFEKIVDVDFCVCMYENENVPIFRMAMAYGVCDSTLREYMIKHSVNLKGHECGINSHNSYFSNIDTKDKAYFLGLLAADGSIKGNEVKLGLSYYDKYIIERFLQYSNLKAPFAKDIRHANPVEHITVSSPQVKEDLAKYGIVHRKSYLDSVFLPSKINSDLIPHFIRGYFDGNGIANSKGYIGFCGSETIITQIHDYFVTLYNVKNTKITYNKMNHIYYIQWGSKKDIKTIFEAMYKDKSDLFLIRKYEKIYNKLSPEVQQCTDLNLNKPA